MKERIGRVAAAGLIALLASGVGGCSQPAAGTGVPAPAAGPAPAVGASAFCAAVDTDITTNSTSADLQAKYQRIAATARLNAAYKQYCS